MANIYVRSTDGSDSDNGSTWALAKATIAGAAAIDAAGDTIYLSQDHNEDSSANITATFAGTLGNPVRIIAANDGAEPPTAVAATATISTSGGSNSIGFYGSIYCYGLNVQSASGVVNSPITLNDYAVVAGVRQVWENCVLNVRGTGSASYLVIVSSGAANQRAGHVVLKNTNVGFVSQSCGIYVMGQLFWNGGAVLSGSSAATAIFGFGENNGRGGRATISGVDLSALASSVNIFFAQRMHAGTQIIRNCKLPSGWSGSLITGTIDNINVRCEMYNCDSGDTNYRLWVEDYCGSIKHDSGVYLDASDGTTGISWKMVSSPNSRYPVADLRSPEIVRWNETTGSAITATVEVVLDSATALNDDDCWLEVQYLGTSGYPLGSFINDCKADVLATAAAQDSSSATWTGTGGFSNEQKRKLSVTFTPQEKGYIHAVVCLAKASTTVYVDPLLTVS